MFAYRSYYGLILLVFILTLSGCSSGDMQVFNSENGQSSTSDGEKPYKFIVDKAYTDTITDCSFYFDGLQEWGPKERAYWRKFISPYVADRAHHFMRNGEFVAIVFQAHGNTASITSCGFKWDAHLDFEADTVVEKRKVGYIPGTTIPNYDANFKKQRTGEQNFNIPPMLVRWCNFRLPVAPEDLGKRPPTVQVDGICNVNKKFAVAWLEERRRKAKRNVKLTSSKP